MRFRLPALLLLLASGAATPHCESQDSRLYDVCETLGRCTDYIDEAACSHALTDAINDSRISTSAVARCAACLGAHSPEGKALGKDPCSTGGAASAEVTEHDLSCRRLLSDRVCDAACAGVPFVTGARTSFEMRREICDAASNCGTSETYKSCRKLDACVFQAPLGDGDGERRIQAQLDIDAEIDACRSCVVNPSKLSGGGRAAAQSDQGHAPVCQLLVDGCSESCRKTPVSDTLRLAQQVLDACKADACFVRKNGSVKKALEAGGAGGEPAMPAEMGGAGDGGAGGDGNQSKDGPCFERVMAWLGNSPADGPTIAQGGATAMEPSPEEQLGDCATCVANNDCASITQPCRNLCANLPLGEIK